MQWVRVDSVLTFPSSRRHPAQYVFVMSVMLPFSSNCHFENNIVLQHVVYNQVDPALRNSYGRPSYMDDKTWKKVRATIFVVL